ncbi:MAG: hypothetical protein ACO1RX_07065 [Candidatus Sericytochromatia bacterium]
MDTILYHAGQLSFFALAAWSLLWMLHNNGASLGHFFRRQQGLQTASCEHKPWTPTLHEEAQAACNSRFSSP